MGLPSVRAINQQGRRTNERRLFVQPIRLAKQISKEIDQKVLVTEIAQISFGLNALGSDPHVYVCVYLCTLLGVWVRYVLSVTVCDYGHFN